MDSKRENFKRIAEKRTNKIVDLISKLNNLTNLQYYEYTDEQIDSMFKAIQKELDIQKKIFKDLKKGKRKIEL